MSNFNTSDLLFNDNTSFSSAGKLFNLSGLTDADDVISYAGSGDGSLDELADYLTTGYWYYSSGVSGTTFDTRFSNIITVNLSGLDTAGRRMAEAALEAWEMVADLKFELTTSSADITFKDNSGGAYSSASYYGSYTLSATINIPSSWLYPTDEGSYGDYDDYGFQTYMHELGHALGLGHQGPYNGGAVYGVSNEFTNDSWMYSVMSYFSQTQNTDVDGSYAYVMTPMMVDIIAIQDLYGAPGEGSATWGATIWGHNSNLGTYLDELLNAATGGTQSYVGENPMTFTIYDAGGIDIINLSTMNDDIDLDMRGAQSSSLGDLVNVVHIARGTFIENAYLGGGDDVVTGNFVNNWIRSGTGDDVVFGNGGNDRLILAGGADLGYGGNGNDTVDGGFGDDRMFGGNGDDRMFGGNGSDIVNGAAGKDVIFGGNGQDTIQGGNGNDKIFAGAQNDSISGGFGKDYIADGFGNDIINGGWGSDMIVFAQGDDTATGGGGVDYFVFGSNDGNDRVTDFTLGTDVLRLDDALWDGDLSAEEVIEAYASVDSAQTVFTFDDGEILTLSSVTDLGALEDSLVII
ncbi:M10 family metallopeptidase [Pacificibacter sp. AS14]|uniref:M10 family metallopeptidase n=1 Tax=Pacificibacter sp. AS14 TaxID=3135785 RepID=UPI00316F809F